MEVGKWDRRRFASPGSHRKWLLEEYRCCHCFLLLSSLKSGLTRGMPFTITAMPVSQFTTRNCLKKKLKREEGGKRVSVVAPWELKPKDRSPTPHVHV
jgi:hypothetical protein